LVHSFIVTNFETETTVVAGAYVEQQRALLDISTLSTGVGANLFWIGFFELFLWEIFN
jgi:hypothetical protein